jgi:hypothetical protein
MCENRASRLLKVLQATEVYFFRWGHEVLTQEEQGVLPTACLITRQLYGSSSEMVQRLLSMLNVINAILYWFVSRDIAPTLYEDDIALYQIS